MSEYPVHCGRCGNYITVRHVSEITGGEFCENCRPVGDALIHSPQTGSCKPETEKERSASEDTPEGKSSLLDSSGTHSPQNTSVPMVENPEDTSKNFKEKIWNVTSAWMSGGCNLEVCREAFDKAWDSSGIHGSGKARCTNKGVAEEIATSEVHSGSNPDAPITDNKGCAKCGHDKADHRFHTGHRYGECDTCECKEFITDNQNCPKSKKDSKSKSISCSTGNHASASLSD